MNRSDGPRLPSREPDLGLPTSDNPYLLSDMRPVRLPDAIVPPQDGMAAPAIDEDWVEVVNASMLSDDAPSLEILRDYLRDGGVDAGIALDSPRREALYVHPDDVEAARGLLEEALRTTLPPQLEGAEDAEREIDEIVEAKAEQYGRAWRIEFVLMLVALALYGLIRLMAR